jgi:RNA polymerase sigma-70 factor (ECF subfamily)
MSENLEHSFVAQLKENQNIIHRFVGYILIARFTQNLFQEVTIQLWKAFPNLEAIANFPLGPTA